MRRRGLIGLVAVIAMTGCQDASTDRALPGPSPTVSSPSPMTTPSQEVSPPIIGRLKPYEVDYTWLMHMQELSGWGSIQRGVNVLVISGQITKLQPHTHSLAFAHICSITLDPLDQEQTKRVRDLLHCHTDKQPAGAYEVVRQQGTTVYLRRGSNEGFTFDLRNGAFSAS